MAYFEMKCSMNYVQKCYRVLFEKSGKQDKCICKNF